MSRRTRAPRRTETGWFARLVGASADGATVHGVVAAMRARGADGCEALYRLASIEAATGAVADIVPLPGIFA